MTSPSAKESVTKADRGLAALAHLSANIPLLPILFWLGLRKRSRFLAIESAEASNFSLSYLFYAVGTTVFQVVFALIGLTALVYLVGFIWLALSLMFIVELIRGIYHVLRGEHHEHRFTMNIIKKPVPADLF